MCVYSCCSISVCQPRVAWYDNRGILPINKKPGRSRPVESWEALTLDHTTTTCSITGKCLGFTVSPTLGVLLDQYVVVEPFWFIMDLLQVPIMPIEVQALAS